MKKTNKPLGEVAEIVMGTSPKGISYNKDGTGKPLLNGPTEFGSSHPSCSLFTTDSKRECQKGDLIFCVRGSTTGRMNWADRRYSLGRGVCSIRGETEADTKFLRYCIEARLEALLKLSGGATFPNLTRNDLNSFTIPYPSNRREIASIISAYDDLIENNNRRIRILEEMAQSHYREWFVHFRFPGHEKAKLVDSPLGKIPKGWAVKKAGDVLDFHIGGGWGKEQQTEEHPIAAYVIRGTDIPAMQHAIVGSCPLRFHKRSNFKTRKLKKGDIVFEVSGGSKGQPVGRALLVNQELLRLFVEPAICASFCKLLRPNSEVLTPELLYLRLIQMYDDGGIGKYQVQSTGITNFKFAYFLGDALLLIPNQALQARFSEVIDPTLALIQALGVQNNNLRHTRDLLLPKLVLGELIAR